MSLNASAYKFHQGFSHLYKKIVASRPSEYFKGFGDCPCLLFKSSMTNYSVYGPHTPDDLWRVLFRHKRFGLAFFAYHAAILVCYPRLTFMPCWIGFNRFSQNRFNRIDLITVGRDKKRHIISIDSIWFEYFIQDIHSLPVFTSSLRRANTWKMFFAALKLHNAIISEMQSEYGQLALIPAPGETWFSREGHIRQANEVQHIYEWRGISVFDNGELLHKKECRVPLDLVAGSPPNWTMDNFVAAFF